ncbi:MAG: dephospho-CoA kinase [Hyphomicrobiales bacterium]|nr:dephospho-CoA kinase [Hyphomicrobiales bacterium]MBV8442032.1 dephospho-CoA kinase [Hyphomicrobiales bacterium]
MIVAGLTGSIAMGKSTVAAMFAALGAPVFDADAAVRSFYAGKGREPVEAMFPGVLVNGGIDRDRLAQLVLTDPTALKRLEGLVHPAVADAEARFIERAAAEGRRLTIVDVPLLFETGGESGVDLVVVVSAPERVQRARALQRHGMSDAKLDAMRSRQISDVEKRRRAHFVIDTSGSMEQTRMQVSQFMRAVAGLAGNRDRRA